VQPLPPPLALGVKDAVDPFKHSAPVISESVCVSVQQMQGSEQCGSHRKSEVALFSLGQAQPHSQSAEEQKPRKHKPKKSSIVEGTMLK
jgi:hypothetical protein